MFKIKKDRFVVKQKLFIHSSTIKNKISYVKASVISISLALLFGVFFLMIMGINGFGFIAHSLFAPLTDWDSLQRVLIWFSIFALLGLGLALGFKIKMFNMGGSGQAIAGVFISYVVLHSIAKSAEEIKNVSIGFGIPIFILFIMIGAAVSCLTGLFKVFFNIHEVATSIVLNWIIWYMFKFYLSKAFNSTIAQQNSPLLFEPFGDYLWLAGIIFVLISVFVLWFFYHKTTIGYKYKIVGLQPEAAKYAGINNKAYIIGIAALQGVFMSAAGFLYYFGLKGSVKMTNDLIPTLGFDGIPIALVAFNNFIGVVPVAILWACLKEGIELSQASPQYMGLPAETADLLFGFIIYSSALYVFFIKLDFVKMYWQLLLLFKSSVCRENMLKFNNEIKEVKQEKRNLKKDASLAKILVKLHQSSSEIERLFAEAKITKQGQLKNKNQSIFLAIEKEQANNKYLKFEVQEIKRLLLMKNKNKVKELKENRKEYLLTEYLAYKNSSLRGLKEKYVFKLNEKIYSYLDKISEIDKQYFDQTFSINTLKSKRSENLNFKLQKNKLKKDYQEINQDIMKKFKLDNSKIKEKYLVNKSKFKLEKKQILVIFKKELGQIDKSSKVQIKALKQRKYVRLMEVGAKYASNI